MSYNVGKHFMLVDCSKILVRYIKDAYIKGAFGIFQLTGSNFLFLIYEDLEQKYI